jgi:hypothetical protein
VCATSIKVLESDDNRESFWTELRDEIKSHATKLNCNCVLGYTEQISIHDEVLLLYCSGTAAQLDLSAKPKEDDDIISVTNHSPRASKVSAIDIPNQQSSRRSSARIMDQEEKEKEKEKANTRNAKTPSCRSCHIVFFFNKDIQQT